MNFQECVLECYEHREFVHHFNRLCGATLHATGINGAVDAVTGKRDSDMTQFIAFVREYVWGRLDTAPLAGDGGKT